VFVSREELGCTFGNPCGSLIVSIVSNNLAVAAAAVPVGWLIRHRVAPTSNF
jgi:hypothetical protein